MTGLFQIARVIRPEGAFGMLMFRWQPIGVSLERSFDSTDNAQIAVGEQRVVVPDGISTCRKSRYFDGGYDTYEILVPGHTRVLFHKLNVERQSKGCVGIGESFAVFNDPARGLVGPGIANSEAGFTEFMRLAAGVPEFELFAQTIDQT